MRSIHSLFKVQHKNERWSYLTYLTCPTLIVAAVRFIMSDSFTMTEKQFIPETYKWDTLYNKVSNCTYTTNRVYVANINPECLYNMKPIYRSHKISTRQEPRRRAPYLPIYPTPLRNASATPNLQWEFLGSGWTGLWCWIERPRLRTLSWQWYFSANPIHEAMIQEPQPKAASPKPPVQRLCIPDGGRESKVHSLWADGSSACWVRSGKNCLMLGTTGSGPKRLATRTNPANEYQLRENCSGCPAGNKWWRNLVINWETGKEG